jgi:predicted Holliday junction resolvase-like endonuclease
MLKVKIKINKKTTLKVEIKKKLKEKKINQAQGIKPLKKIPKHVCLGQTTSIVSPFISDFSYNSWLE